MPYRHTLLFLLATLTTINVSAWSRIADAHIHSINGIPCFSITKKEEARNGTPMLGALIVSDLSVQPAKKVWSFSAPPDWPIPIHAASCIRYGYLPPTATGIKPKSLVPGHFYSVFLNGRSKDPSDPTYGYQGKFCVRATADGGQQVITINSDMQAWIDEICPANTPAQKSQ
ncbi:hypothetical protein [Janthinobacterium rivuli]|uniref:hypothetical protein n=1 Tax=Janthinobacterium rivuli TaxID=2751478 RepID=UPI00383A4F32